MAELNAAQANLDSLSGGSYDFGSIDTSSYTSSLNDYSSSLNDYSSSLDDTWDDWDSKDYGWSAEDQASLNKAAKGAVGMAGGILALIILAPIIFCICVAVCVCACTKSCCFAPKAQAPVVVMGGQTGQPKMMVPK